LYYNFLMRKRINYLLWIVGILLAVGAIPLVARQQHAAREKQEAKRAQDCLILALTPAERHDCTKDSQSREDYSDWWDILVAWPNGIETWALIATLGAIIWQAWETRKTADAANVNLNSTFRPRLIVRKMHISKGTVVPTFGVPDAQPWEIRFDIANVGQGVADILDYGFFVQWGTDPNPNRVLEMGGESPFSLTAGEDCQRSIQMSTDLVNMLRLIGSEGLEKGYQGTDKIFVVGIAQYADRIGTKRNISVCRRYDNKAERFIAVDDPDREYSD